MSTKSKIAIALFILQIISTAGIVIGTSKDYLGALASAIGLSVFMIIAAILVLLDNKEKQDKINQLNKKYVENKTDNKTAPTLTIIDDEASIDEDKENIEKSQDILQSNSSDFNKENDDESDDNTEKLTSKENIIYMIVGIIIAAIIIVSVIVSAINL